MRLRFDADDEHRGLGLGGDDEDGQPGATLHHLHALARFDDLIVRAGVRLAERRMELEGRAGEGTGAARLRGLAVRLERRLESLEEARRGVVLARLSRHARAVWLEERGASSER